MKNIILISGKAEAGKDLTASILKEKLEAMNNRVCIMHFADAVKFFAKQYLGWNGVKDEVGRTLLQQFGTEKVRSIYPDFWAMIINNLAFALMDDFDYFLVPDTRFPNEVNYFFNTFAKKEVISLKVNRIDHENCLTPEQREHPSETAMDDFKFSYIINSKNGMDYLSKEVDKFISRMLVDKDEA